MGKIAFWEVRGENKGIQYHAHHVMQYLDPIPNSWRAVEGLERGNAMVQFAVFETNYGIRK